MKKVCITAEGVTEIDRGKTTEALKRSGFEVAEQPYPSFSSEEEFCRFLAGADALLAGTEPLTREVLSCAPKLSVISRRGVGYNNVDLDFCAERGISVAITAGAVEDAVAELTMGYLLNFARKIPSQSHSLSLGNWHRELSHGLSGATLGLVGFGGIGQAVCRLANAFSMRVCYYAPHRHPDAEASLGARYLPLDGLLGESDYVSLHLPLNAATRQMFGLEQFRKMKQSAVFVNTARGGLVEEAALAKALQEGVIAGAAVDVFEREPCSDSPLMGLPNVILTPHSGTFTENTFTQMNLLAAQNITDYFRGALPEPYRVL